eukprot:gene9517-10520_t
MTTWKVASSFLGTSPRLILGSTGATVAANGINRLTIAAAMCQSSTLAATTATATATATATTLSSPLPAGKDDKPAAAASSSSSSSTVVRDDRYEFIDCGMGKRLERFGSQVVSRSCVAASKWNCYRLHPMWKPTTNLVYEGSPGKMGRWKGPKVAPWIVRFDRKAFLLHTFDMGQVGIFPEQEENWKWIESVLTSHIERLPPNANTKPIRVLNTFAFTGGSTMAALVHEDVQVTHVDASKSFTNLASKNVDLSETAGSIRWVVEDCLTFLQREVKRGNQYDAIIFDPPAFGRYGTKMWKIEKDLPILLDLLPNLLSDNPAFVLFTCHDERWPAEKMREVLQESLRKKFKGGSYEHGEMILKAEQKRCRSLPSGSFARWQQHKNEVVVTVKKD